MSKKLHLIKVLRVSLIVFTLGFFGCQNQSQVADSSTNTVQSGEAGRDRPKVVVTTSILCDLTKQIAQETINLICMIPPDTNPLFYQPKPEDREAFEQAKLILYNGYNIEPGFLKTIRARNNSGLKIAVAQRAVSKPLRFTADGKTLPDPYIWHNAKNAVSMVEVVNRYLAKAVPENASLYSSNTQRLKKELTELDTWITSRITSIPKENRRLVTTRDAMFYYAKAYGLVYTGVLDSMSTKETLTLKREKALIKYIRRNRIPTIFLETTNNPDAINTLAQKANVKVSERKLLTDSVGVPGSEGDTYQKMMVENTRTIVEGLGGTYLIFEPKVFRN